MIDRSRVLPVSFERRHSAFHKRSVRSVPYICDSKVSKTYWSLGDSYWSALSERRMASPDKYLSGRRVESASRLSCSATLLLALILNHLSWETTRMKFSKDRSQACRVDGEMSLENSHALITMLFFSIKFVLNFLSKWGLWTMSILIMVCIPQLLVDWVRSSLAGCCGEWGLMLLCDAIMSLSLTAFSLICFRRAIS